MKFQEHEAAYRRAVSALHKGRFSRREILRKMGAGFGTVGLAGMFQQAGLGTAGAATRQAVEPSPLTPKLPHFAPRAKHVIQLFMPGGPSQVDTFDYKPSLAKYAGQRPGIVDRKSLRNTKGGLAPSYFGFKQHGNCGKWVSDIFPKVGEVVDDLCFIHSMHTDIPEHAGAILMTNVGSLQPNRPSMGSWLVYGLGTGNEDLPGFVAMSPRAQPRGKLANWGNSFLPGAYAGAYVNIQQMKPDAVMRNLKNAQLSRTEQRKQADLLTKLNKLHLDRRERDRELEAGIEAMEMAFRMQFSVPDVFDIEKESEAT
ncbi:MAG: DUF1501 domain-containing protein, partial [Roseibacillus sp.]|nr:DUF1501 domain-containing protein [Roseibacillus sp.]